jgi:hypothetical protein
MAQDSFGSANHQGKEGSGESYAELCGNGRGGFPEISPRGILLFVNFTQDKPGLSGFFHESVWNNLAED